MEILTTVINDCGPQILSAILTAVCSAMALGIKAMATKYINTEIKQSLAKTAVKAVEQAYRDIHGEEKLNKAMAYLSDVLGEYGLKASPTELKLLLEAAVGEFNRVFEKSSGA